MSTPGSRSGTLLEMQAVTPKTAVRVIKNSFRTNWALGLWGPMGFAKSSVIQQLAAELGWALIDTRVSTKNPEDITGVPFPVTLGGMKGCEWTPPFFVPRDLDYNFAADVEAEADTEIEFYNPRGNGNQVFYCQNPKIRVRPFSSDHKAEVIETVLDAQGARRCDRFLLKLTDAEGNPVAGRVRVYIEGEVFALWALEEFNSGDESIQAACYQLLLDRMLNELRIGKNVRIVATGNLEDTGGLTYTLLAPVGNRMTHYVMRMSFAEWYEWAFKYRAHPSILAYLSQFNDDLNTARPNTKDKAVATPRSWIMLSDLLAANPYLLERKPDGSFAHPDELRATAYGCIGMAASRWYTFTESVSGVVEPEKILSGAQHKVVYADKFHTGLLHYLMLDLVAKLRDETDTIQNRHGRNFTKSPEHATWLKRADNFFLFLEASCKSSEQIIVGAVTAYADYKLPMDDRKMPAFRKFLESDHSDRMIAMIDANRVKVG